MAVRVIKKSLAGSEDLLLGFGTEVQVRNDKNIEITKINASTIPYDENKSIADSITKKVDTLANMRAMNELPETVWCSGYHSKNDGAFGSHFYRLKGLKTTEIDNSGTIIIVSVGGSDYVYELQYEGAVNVKWFGAVPYTSTGVNIDSSTTINNTYVYCVNNSIPMEISNNFYITNGLVFSLRAGVSSIYMIKADCTIFADFTTDISAVYVGDDSSNGIYNLNIDGTMIISNISGSRVGVGLHLQSAAYGYYNVVARGFDIGIKLEGAIFVTVDGKGGNVSNNNIDIVMESNQGAQGGLRHTNNNSKIINMSLNSGNKVLMRYGDNSGSVGGIIQFDNILFEGRTATDYDKDASIVCYGTAEGVPSYLGKIQFTNSWFEAFDISKPLFRLTDSDVTLNYCFIANVLRTDPYFVMNSTSTLHFKNTTGYFSDREPTYLVGPINGTDTKYRGEIILESTVFYGTAGTMIAIHDGISTAGTANRISTFSGTSNTRIMRLSGKSGIFPANSTGEYMQDGTMNITTLLDTYFGANWQSFSLYISGSDGGSVSTALIEGQKYTGGTQKYVLTRTSGSGTITTSDNITFAFPTTLYAGWFRPTFFFKVDVIDSGLLIA